MADEKRIESIASLIPDGELLVSVEYPELEGFVVEFANLSASQWRKLTKKASRRVYDPGSRTFREELDDDRIQDIIASKVIRGWSGLTVEGLRRLIPAVQIEGKDDVEVAYTPENARLLLDYSLSFQSWVSEVMLDVGAYARRAKEEEAKNS